VISLSNTLCVHIGGVIKSDAGIERFGEKHLSRLFAAVFACEDAAYPRPTEANLGNPSCRLGRIH